jgi:hypothetical protein
VRPIFSSNLSHRSQKTGSFRQKSCRLRFDITIQSLPPDYGGDLQ